jgi:DNA (cytosine-5)-methyltransferase 1
MKFGSVCSGIEAASVAWEPLGWKAAWFSEIEPFPSAVLKHHYPDTPNLGDMTALPDRIKSGEVQAPDLFCGGTPCQAFSVAGLRKSLDDARGNLSLTFCEIANAIDNVRLARGEPAAIIFWENVPGVLNTKDNAFGCFLAGLAGEELPLLPPGGKWTNAGCVFGPQRAVAWRVLDAQYFGVAQRRRRVFVVASARDDFDPAAVLLEWEGLRRDTAPSREAGKAIAGTIEASLGRSRGAGTPTAAVVEQPYSIANCLTARMHKGINSTLDEGQTPVVTNLVAAEITGALTVGHHSCAGHQHRQGDASFLVAQPISIHPHCIGRSPEAGPQGKEYLMDGSAYCMDSRGQPQAIAFHPTQDPISSTDGTTHAMGCGSSGGQASVAVALNIYGGNKRADRPEGGFYVKHEETSKTLDAASGLNPTCSQGGTAVMTAMQVRRLTPVECERLQGFPDNYTAIPWRKKPITECPDGPRYKSLGNSWAVPVVRWIGNRIQTEIECKPKK